MKAKILAALSGFVLLGFAVYYDGVAEIPEVPQSAAKASPEALMPVPRFSFTTIDGKKFNINDLKEDIILVHFWAGWCTVCFAEFPGLLEHVKKSDGKVALIAISIDEDFSAGRKFLDKLKGFSKAPLEGSTIYWVWDEGKAISLNIFNTIRVPETIVVDRNRIMIDKIVGPGPWDGGILPYKS